MGFHRFCLFNQRQQIEKHQIYSQISKKILLKFQMPGTEDIKSTAASVWSSLNKAKNATLSSLRLKLRMMQNDQIETKLNLVILNKDLSPVVETSRRQKVKFLKERSNLLLLQSCFSQSLIKKIPNEF